MEQLTEDQAKAVYESRVWETWTPHQKVEFQLFTDRLCMPFDIFHGAVEEVLGRGVFTHEFAFVDHLRREFLGERAAPTFREICALIPADKLLIVYAT